MILPDIVLSSRANQHWQYSGIDSPKFCLNKEYFRNYPYHVDYVYNSRGFRDAEWPLCLQELQEAVWCIGDSFTVGIGQSFGHIWPQVLSRCLQTRTINVSMDGASNDWICRRAMQIQTEITPKLMVVLWSYAHRRESTNIYLDDENRRIYTSRASAEQDFLHWLNLVANLRSCGNNIIESTIPGFQHVSALQQLVKSHWEAIKDSSWPPCPESLDDFDALPGHILTELQDLHGCYISMRSSFLPPDIEISAAENIDTSDIINITGFDWARDHCHFGRQTSEWLVGQILQRMKTLDFSRNDPLPVLDS